MLMNELQQRDPSHGQSERRAGRDDEHDRLPQQRLHRSGDGQQQDCAHDEACRRQPCPSPQTLNRWSRRDRGGETGDQLECGDQSKVRCRPQHGMDVHNEEGHAAQPQTREAHVEPTHCRVGARGIGVGGVGAFGRRRHLVFYLERGRPRRSSNVTQAAGRPDTHNGDDHQHHAAP